MEELLGTGNNHERSRKTLWTERFFYIHRLPPPPISYSPNFTFDLQRFAEVSSDDTDGYIVDTKTIKKDSSEPTKYFIEGDDTNTKYTSLEDAIAAAANANFVVTKSTTTGEGASAITTKTYTYYDSADDFKSANLTTSEKGASITAIKVYGDVNLQDATTVTSTITVEKSATLNLNGKTLKKTSEGTLIKINDSVENGTQIVFTVSDSGGTGKIIHTYDPMTGKDTDDDYKKAGKNARYSDKAVISVGGKDTNAYGSKLVMTGGTIESNTTCICGTNNSEIEIKDSTVQSYMSSAIFLGNGSVKASDNKTSTFAGGQKLTVENSELITGVEFTDKTTESINKNDVEITRKKNSNLPAIQVSGNYNNTEKTGSVDNTELVKDITLKKVDVIVKGDSIIKFNNDENGLLKNTNGEYIGNTTAIYIGGYAKLTVTDNVQVISGGTGIEMRAGELEIPTVSNVKVESTAKTYTIREKGNTSGSTTFGAAIAISQHDTNLDVTTDVKNGNFKAPVAFVVENPQKNPTGSKITANLTGGTYESTDAKAAIAAKSSDGRATVNIENVTFVGNLEDAVADAGPGGESSPAFTVTGKVTIAKKEGDNVVPVAEYDSTTATLTYKAADGKSYTVQEGWWNLVANQWLYLVADSTDSLQANAIATVKPAIEGTEPATVTSTTTLELTTGTATAESVLPLDMTTDMFKAVEYKILDASNVIADNKFKLNITGNDYTESIIGGAGNDTIKAIHSVGAFLNGGMGDDLLIGGDGKDTFAFSNGSDTIQGYVYGTDVVSLGSNDYKLPETFAGINNSDSSNFVLAVGENASLTFRPTTSLTIAQGDDTFSYTASTIAKNANISLGAGYTSKEYDGRNLAYQVIDASQVTTTSGINLRANDKNSALIGASTGGALYGGEGNDTLQSGGGSTTLNGGAGSDSLVGGGGADVFIYDGKAGGTDTVSGYGDNDLVNVRNVRLSDAEFKSETTPTGAAPDTTSTTNISLSWGGDDNLIFQDVENKVVSVKSGSSTYLYTKNYYAHNKGITLAAGYDDGETGKNYKTFDGASDDFKNYATINAAAVNNAISVMGNSLNNYIVGSTATPTSAITVTLNGGEGNDRFDVNERYVASATQDPKSTKYVFEHSAGKDEVFGFNQDNDILGITVADIKSAKAGNSKLTFTIGKDNSVVLRGDDDITKVNVVSGASYLTKDGYVTTTTTKSVPEEGGEGGEGTTTTTTTLKLFSSAKGRIELGDDIYKLDSGAIGEVDATSVEKQSVTLVAGSTGGTFKFNGTNKKRDGFVYGGGQVSISGYEDGKDRIDLNGASITSFTIENTNDVKLLLNSSTDDSQIISIKGAKDKEVLLRDGSSRSFKKMVFAENGILQNKAKNPTMVTVSAGAGGTAEAKSYTVSDNSVKKVFVTDIDKPISIKAGDKNNTIIDASAAANAVTLSGGKKNDKLIGSNHADTFVYSAGKDIIQNFVDTGDAKDQISLSSDQFGKLGEAKITAGSKSIKFKFANKDTLTIKATKGSSLSGSLDIASANNTGDITRTYTKNAIAKDGGLVTLTSAFSGTFKTDDKKLAKEATTVDGTRVSKNLTFKGTAADESLTGGMKKNTFKGGGGDDTFTGGSGKDIFFYAKGEKGKTTIANFEFGANKDKLKIASGTIGEISTLDSGKTIQFAMNSGKKGDTSNIGWFKVTSAYNSSTKASSQDITASNVAIKANNTYYWFATQDIKDKESGDVLAEAGQLITSDTRVSAGDVSDFDILELNYSTNLAKSGVAVKVAGVKPKNG